MKQWMIITVENSVLWPAEETSVDFGGRELILRPPSDDSAADIRMQYEHPDERLQVFETILRFLSALSWSEKGPARARLRIECTAPMRGGKGNSSPILCPGFTPTGLNIPDNPQARLAIAIYREAKSVHNTQYEFLNYFKIINILYRNGPSQEEWINDTIPHLSDKNALARIEELKADESDIGAYLYKSGRCAVAHAGVDPIVDPDNPSDFLRLSADMPVIQALAEYLIITELGMS